MHEPVLKVIGVRESFSGGRDLKFLRVEGGGGDGFGRDATTASVKVRVLEEVS